MSYQNCTCLLIRFFILLLVYSQSSISLWAATGSAGSDPSIRTVFLNTKRADDLNARWIESLESTSHSPVVISVYSLLGTKVIEQSLAPEAPAFAIQWRNFSRELAQLPFGYYFCELQPRNPATKAQSSDSLLFRDVTDSNLLAGLTYANYSRFGDLNGDAYPDLILGRALRFGRAQVFINDGTGRFVDETASRLPVEEFATTDIELLDVELDGDLDILSIAQDRTIVITESVDRLYLNDGSGTFTDVSDTYLPTLPIVSNRAAWGLINEDSLPDLVVAGMFKTSEPFESSLFVLINDGTGHFVDQTNSLLPANLDYGVFDVALADVNGDQRQDIVLANMEMAITGENDPTPLFVYSGQNAVLVQNEENKFVDKTRELMPEDHEPTKLIRTTDINNDGAPELYVINVSFVTAIPHQLYLNDGNGVFADATAARLPQQSITFLNDATFEDYDANGFVDLYLVNVSPFGEPPAAPDLLFLNEDGFFSDRSQSRLPSRSDFGVSSGSADIERDGDFDIFVSNGTGSSEPAKDKLLENLSTLVNVAETRETVPEALSLYQNYPNPFNSATVIRYVLSRASEITLRVYDVQGTEIATLVSGRVSAGEHRCEWDANDYASGVYYYQLKANDFVDTKKLVVIR